MQATTRSLFTYGSLMYEAVCFRVVGRGLPHERAQLHGWRRHALKGRTYPGAVPQTDCVIDGVLWHGLTEADLVSLDAFESTEYERVTATVLPASGQTQPAQLYAWQDLTLLEPDDWSVTRFEQEHVHSFYATHRPR
jgi:gamma-glutamylcyclotransferase (GGCT)/AIG2-like uncharacterized protein YtfP